MFKVHVGPAASGLAAHVLPDDDDDDEAPLLDDEDEEAAPLVPELACEPASASAGSQRPARHASVAPHVPFGKQGCPSLPVSSVELGSEPTQAVHTASAKAAVTRARGRYRFTGDTLPLCG